MNEHSKCKRMEVRATGHDRYNNRISVTNGNLTECTNEAGNCGCIHAEERLLQIMPNPLTVTVSHSPCLKCAMLLAKSGVESIMYIEEYRLTVGIDYLKDRGIKVFKKGEHLQ